MSLLSPKERTCKIRGGETHKSISFHDVLSSLSPTQLLLNSSQPFPMPSKSFIFNFLIKCSFTFFGTTSSSRAGTKPEWHSIDSVSLMNWRRLGATTRRNCIVECQENSPLGFPSRKYHLRVVNLNLTFASAHVTTDSHLNARWLEISSIYLKFSGHWLASHLSLLPAMQATRSEVTKEIMLNSLQFMEGGSRSLANFALLFVVTDFVRQ